MRRALPSFNTVVNVFFFRLHHVGLHARIPAEKILLQPAHREERFNLAVDYVEWPEEFWVHRVLFSDEKSFRSDTNGTLQVWRARGTR